MRDDGRLSGVSGKCRLHDQNLLWDGHGVAMGCWYTPERKVGAGAAAMVGAGGQARLVMLT